MKEDHPELKYYIVAFEVFGSFVPGVGEVQDGMVLADSSLGVWTRLVAGVSLVANLCTLGMAPNAGGFIRGGDEALDWFAVVPKKGSFKGQSRIDHVGLHNIDIPYRTIHGVFFDDAVDVVNEAWERARKMGLKPTDGVLTVPMGARSASRVE